MATISAELERELTTPAPAAQTAATPAADQKAEKSSAAVSAPDSGDRPTAFPEVSAEQTPDGAFRRQPNLFTARFATGDATDERHSLTVEPGRYRLLGSVGCGWARRQLIVLRLLGLEEAVPFVPLYGRDSDGWRISAVEGDIASRFGTDRLNYFYERSRPGFTGRGTSPTLLDLETGTVATNNYHVLSNDFEVAWQPFHKAGAPDLYPEALRQEIDLLNQQIFDDVNNGTYRVIFATNPAAARVSIDVFHARLAEYDFRLASRRYLFGEQVTDSDVRLFQTLSSFERSYRPRIAHILGEDQVRHLHEYENLWAYARDLFAQGFADEREQYFLGLIPGPSGEYSPHRGFTGALPLPSAAEALAAWQEPSGRDALGGSAVAAGPGTGGSIDNWRLV